MFVSYLTNSVSVTHTGNRVEVGVGGCPELKPKHCTTPEDMVLVAVFFILVSVDWYLLGEAPFQSKTHSIFK